MPVGKEQSITTNADISFLKKDLSEDGYSSDLTTAPNLTRKKGFSKPNCQVAIWNFAQEKRLSI